jgi:hypothetical protein
MGPLLLPLLPPLLSLLLPPLLLPPPLLMPLLWAGLPMSTLLELLGVSALCAPTAMLTVEANSTSTDATAFSM